MKIFFGQIMFPESWFGDAFLLSSPVFHAQWAHAHVPTGSRTEGAVDKVLCSTLQLESRAFLQDRVSDFLKSFSDYLLCVSSSNVLCWKF